jgi:hypothetical protein
MESGKTVWRRERTDAKSGWSTPGLWTNGEREELLVLGVGWLHAYDLATAPSAGPFRAHRRADHDADARATGSCSRPRTT